MHFSPLAGDNKPCSAGADGPEEAHNLAGRGGLCAGAFDNPLLGEVPLGEHGGLVLVGENFGPSDKLAPADVGDLELKGDEAGGKIGPCGTGHKVHANGFENAFDDKTGADTKSLAVVFLGTTPLLAGGGVGGHLGCCVNHFLFLMVTIGIE